MPLLQTVKQNSAAMTDASNPLASQTGMAPTGGSQTQQTAELMGVAQTGKDQGPAVGGQAKLSALGERLANVNTLMSASALQQAGTMQSEAQQQQAEAQQQQFQGQTAQLNQEHINAVEQYNNQVAGILQGGVEQLRQMTLADDKSKVEQLGLMLRLGNDKYVDQLNQKAAVARIDNEASFKLALNQSVFAQESNLFGSSLQFRNYLQADERQSVAQLAQMDLDFALQVATADNKAAAAQTMWSGIGTIAGTAASAAIGSDSQATGPVGPEGNMVAQSAQNPADAGAAPNQTAADVYNGNVGSASSLGINSPFSADNPAMVTPADVPTSGGQ